tara:strand:+ start:2844 stop:3419 length:576 start_codon:yes stop_codon:yes gene_type:complete
MKKYKFRLAKFNKLYKKFLIFPFIFLIVACASPDSLIKKDKIRSGMSKYDVDDAIIFGSFWNQIFIPEAYREYFPKERKEVLSGTGKHIYYVFKNVDTKVKCGWMFCEYGNGTLDKTFKNYRDAVDYIIVDKEIAAKKVPKKTITIVENNTETEIPEDDEMMKKLSKLMKDYKSGKISEEEFSSKKAEILN